MTALMDVKQPRFKSFGYTGEPPLDAGEDGSFERLFWNHQGYTINKWHHYLPLYDRYLTPWKGTAVRVLEIGVAKGGSLALWRKFFGDDAILFGVDIMERCARFDGIDGKVRIGSQDDAAFMNAVVDEMGGVDIVLDDGSHYSRHIRASLDILFPRLSVGGLYCIEDLHAIYWPTHEGGYQDDNTFANDVRQMFDDMHHWYHGLPQRVAGTQDMLGAMHLHDSLVVLEKADVKRPVFSRRGGGLK